MIISTHEEERPAHTSAAAVRCKQVGPGGHKQSRGRGCWLFRRDCCRPDEEPKDPHCSPGGPGPVRAGRSDNRKKVSGGSESHHPGEEIGTDRGRHPGRTPRFLREVNLPGQASESQGRLRPRKTHYRGAEDPDQCGPKQPKRTQGLWGHYAGGVRGADAWT